MQQEIVTPQLTMQIIEYGTLDLDSEIQFGTLLLGNTKAGKTTSCHYLTHQVLQGAHNDQKSVVYKLRNVDKKFRNAKIGDKESVSETQIPNLFDYQSEDGFTKYLIDCPGYLDSFGCYRVISNRFFHYQVFSKVKKARFIITFSYTDMKGVAKQMKGTFKAFLKGFKNLQEIKESLCSSTALMITGVPQDKDLDDVVQRYKGTPQALGGDLNAFYRQLKNSLVEKKRIFIFKAAEIGKKCDVNNELLKKIEENTKFWQIDMKYIQISINEYVQEDEQKFQQERLELAKYYRQSVLKDLQVFQKVLTCLNEDNINTKADKQTGEDKFLLQIYDYIEGTLVNRDNICPVTQQYKQKIKKKIDKIFLPVNILGSQSLNYSDIPFWLLRLIAQKKIQNIIGQIATQSGNSDKNYELLSRYLHIIKQVLDIILTIGKLKKYAKDQAKEKRKNQALQRFAYEIYKRVDISNKIFNLVSISIESKNSKKNEGDFSQGMFFVLVEYPSALEQNFVRSVYTDYKEIVLKNLNKYKFDEGFTFKGLIKASKFFKQIKEELSTYDDFCHRTIQIRNSITNSIDNLIIKLESEGLIGVNNIQNPKLENIKQMEEKRKEIRLKIKECNMKAISSEKMKIENNRIIQSIGECLQKNNKHELALKVFDSLYNGFKVIEILEFLEQRKRKGKEPNQLLKFLIEYAGFASKYCRKELAIKKVQEALNIAQQNANIEKIYESTSLLKEIVSDKYAGTSQYIKFMSSDIKQINLSDVLSKEIMDEVRIKDLKVNKTPDNRSKSNSKKKKKKEEK